MNDVTGKPLDSFLDGVEENLRDEEETPWIVYGPRWAQDIEGAKPPPGGLSDPVWTEKTGWIGKDEATRKRIGGPLFLYAPNNLDTGR